MRVLHLDTPRGLSFTLKEWNGKCHNALQGNWHQIDLNFDFWQWILRDDQTGLFEKLVDLHQYNSIESTQILNECKSELSRCGTSLESEINFTGILFPKKVFQSTNSLIEYVKKSPDRNFFANYFKHLCEQFMLLSGYSLISLGVDSKDGLVFASLLADFIHDTDPDVRVCLTRHQFENYSLVNSFDDLVQEGSLFNIFDAIVRYEEQAGEAISSLHCFYTTGKRDNLTNIAVLTEQGILTFPPNNNFSFHTSSVDKSYIDSTLVPPDRLVYFFPLIRNACYYAKCSFCVQNERYLKLQGNKQKKELDRTIKTIDELASIGLTKFSFSDQALHPKTINAFAQMRKGKPNIQWCGRMLLDPQVFSNEFMNTLKKSGCKEILFGAESFSQQTLKEMRKEFGVDAIKLRSLISLFKDYGIDIVLSLIFAFPTEQDEDFESITMPLLCEIAKNSNISIILNRFALFRHTEIENSPTEFGVVKMFEAYLLEEKRDYVDRFGRDSRKPHPKELCYREMLSLSLRGSHLSNDIRTEGTYIDYSSIGLQYRWRTGHYFLDPEDGIGKDLRPKRNVLVLGANSYLGQNLALAIDPQRLILSSRSTRNVVLQKVNSPYLRVDISQDCRPLYNLEPKEVYVIARPTGSFAEQAKFAANLKVLLYEWTRKKHLERIIFMSTQLVYATPDSCDPVPSSSPVEPQATYEYFKTEIEYFLKYLADREKIGVEVFRLPLLYGGEILPSQRSEQFIPLWIDELRYGARWEFLDSVEKTFGNSWVWTPDLVKTMLRNCGNGFHIRQPVSGNFTYAELQDALSPQSKSQQRLLQLVRSTFFLKDNENIKKRNLISNILEDNKLFETSPF